MRTTALTVASVVVPLALAASACSGRAVKLDEPLDLGPTPLELATEAQRAEAEPMLAAMAAEAAAYFSSEQRFDAANGFEPWHPAQLGSETQDVGMLVDAAQRVFPGGKRATFATHSEAPAVGRPEAPDPVTDARLETMLMHFTIDTDQALQFRYVFTSKGCGPRATAELRAEADFDPETPGAHTITVSLGVDPSSGAVRIGEPVVTNPGA